MHEFSIANNIVELVESEARSKNALKVTEVRLDIGELAGIEIDSLNFAWNSIIPNTLLDCAKLKIKRVPGKCLCLSCGNEFKIRDYFDLCPVCQSFKNEILDGKELKVKSIEIEY